MATREDLVEHLWQSQINPLGEQRALDNIVANCRRAPDMAFAEVGPVIERMLAAGIPQADIGLLMRSTAYEAVFGIAVRHWRSRRGWRRRVRASRGHGDLAQREVVSDPSRLASTAGQAF